MTELPVREGNDDRSLVGRDLNPKVRVAMGALISLVAIVALVMGASLGPLGFGLVLACGLATPVVLRLGRTHKERAAGGLRVSGPGPRRSEGSGVPMIPSASTGRDEKLTERQLLEAIERHGEITPVRAALETSLTLAEADRMLSDLVKGGYLEVRVEGGKLLYAL